MKHLTNWLKQQQQQEQEPSLEMYARQAAFQLSLLSTRSRHGFDQESAELLILTYLRLAVTDEIRREANLYRSMREEAEMNPDPNTQFIESMGG